MVKCAKPILVALILGLLQAGCDTMPTLKAGKDDPPNIILILADDLGIGDTGVYGSPRIRTPNIDSLAAGGVRFTQGYVTHPVCSPSRAGLLTGRYQQRHGWEFNPAGRDVNSGMSTRETTMADALKARGYATGMVGKWHLGYKGDYHPQARGFDEFFGVLAGGSIYIDPAAPGVESMGVRFSERFPQIGVYRAREEVRVTEYLTDVFTREAVEFIDRHRDERFFLYLSHTTPHTPLQATRKYLDRYRHVEPKHARIYAAMVSSLDDSVAAVVDKLKQTGLYENTMIVFLSDNGCAGYINNACSNAPHAGFKRYHQEGGIRVPFAISWPKRLGAGIFYDNPVTTLDLFATFVENASPGSLNEFGDLDGIDLVPYITGGNKGLTHEYLYWRSGPTIAIRDGRYKLIRYNRTNLTKADLRADGRLEPPEGGWPYSSPDGQLTLLYDLREDPGETRNLARQHPDIVERLLTEHCRWASELPETPILPAERSTLTEVHGETV